MTPAEPFLFPDLSPVPRVMFGRACIAALIERAAALTGFPRAALMARNGGRTAKLARFAVMKVAHERGKSYAQIGRVFGLDHSSIIHGERRAAALETTDPEFALLTRLLRESPDA